MFSFLFVSGYVDILSLLHSDTFGDIHDSNLQEFV